MIDLGPSTSGNNTNAISIEVFRGIQLTDELSDSFDSDDSYLTFNPGFTVNNSEAPVWIVAEGDLSESPCSLQIVFESNAGTPGLTVTTEAFNFNTNQYDVVDQQSESFNSDSVKRIDISSSISDYVSAGQTETRLGWRQTGFTINFPWEVRIDQLVWQSN